MTRVLIVEDDPSVGAAIRRMLNREGYDVVYAPDADFGIRAFESSHFDLAIVDIFMPGVNGLRTITRFRQRAPSVPIIAMSGFKFRDSMKPDLDVLGLAAKAGAAVCLRKPFAPQQLIAAVHASLNLVPAPLAT
jgi:DNA-binding response OmpR family regulator